MQQIHLSSLAPSRILDFPFKNKEHLEKLPQVLKNHLSMSPFHNCTIVYCKVAQSESVIWMSSTEVGNPSRFLNSDYYSFVCENCKAHKLKDFPHPPGNCLVKTAVALSYYAIRDKSIGERRTGGWKSLPLVSWGARGKSIKAYNPQIYRPSPLLVITTLKIR